MKDDIPTLINRAQVSAAITAINKFADRLTDEGTDGYLQIAYELIKGLEDGTTTSTE